MRTFVFSLLPLHPKRVYTVPNNPGVTLCAISSYFFLYGGLSFEGLFSSQVHSTSGEPLQVLDSSVCSF